MLKALLSASVLALALSATGCSKNLCERKDDFFMNRCPVGGMIAYRPDPMCEENLSYCTDQQKLAMEGYIDCLESMNECSQDVIQRCAQMNPGGVNLFCNRMD